MTELGAERVDVIPYSDDAVEFIEAALQPARVREVQLDEETGEATVIVNSHQLSLAIGKEGQNARLAARLTGWRINIRSDEEEETASTEVWTDGDDVVAVIAEDVVVEEATEVVSEVAPEVIEDAAPATDEGAEA
jgi:N utilization substance protein A